MITVSDNDAANTLVNMLGGGDDSAGMDVVNAFARRTDIPVLPWADFFYTAMKMAIIILP